MLGMNIEVIWKKNIFPQIIEIYPLHFTHFSAWAVSKEKENRNIHGIST